jgi:hypothetical protein
LAIPNTQPHSRTDEESFYWERVFLMFGTAIADAETLAFGAGVDRHAVRLALERGCDPGLVFRIFAPI